MESFTEAVAVARERAALSGGVQWLHWARTGRPAPGDYEWRVWPLAASSVYPNVECGDSPSKVIEEDDGEAFWVYPSGLVLSEADLPWVWRVSLKSGQNAADYVYGTAREAFEYAQGLPNIVDAIQAVDAADLNGLTVRVCVPVCYEPLLGGPMAHVNDELRLVTARPLPQWTRTPGQHPRHERWGGIRPGTKVWPMVPHGFSTDFAFCS